MFCCCVVFSQISLVVAVSDLLMLFVCNADVDVVVANGETGDDLPGDDGKGDKVMMIMMMMMMMMMMMPFSDD